MFKSGIYGVGAQEGEGGGDVQSKDSRPHSVPEGRERPWGASVRGRQSTTRSALGNDGGRAHPTAPALNGFSRSSISENLHSEPLPKGT